MIDTWRREAWFDNYHRHRPVTRLRRQSSQLLLWAHGVHRPGMTDSQLECHCSQLPMEIFSLPPSFATTYLLLRPFALYPTCPVLGSDDRAGLVLPLIKSPSDTNGATTYNTFMLKFNHNQQCSRIMIPEYVSHLAFQQGHQQVAAQDASTVEVVGTAGAEMTKITGHLRSLTIQLCTTIQLKDHSLPLLCWPLVGTQGWNCLVCQSLFWNWKQTENKEIRKKWGDSLLDWPENTVSLYFKHRE